MVVETRTNSWAVDWLLNNGKAVSDIGALAADILQNVFDGIYHVQDIHRVSFAGTYIEVPLFARMATYDSSLLTRLVVLAHDRCVRVELEAKLVRSEYEGETVEFPALVASFSKRERGGDWYHGHPTMEEAIVTARTSRRA
jgi:hypothetical protein